MELLKRYRWPLLGGTIVVLVVAFLLFRPDKLFVDDRVDESLADAFGPIATTEPAAAAVTESTAAASTTTSPATTSTPQQTTTSQPTTTTIQSTTTTGDPSTSTTQPSTTQPPASTTTQPPTTTTTQPPTTTTTQPPTTTTTQPPTTTTTQPAGPVPISTGQFYGINHSAEGTATVYQQGDRFVLRFEDDTDIQNGPDLLVWVLPASDYSGGQPSEYIDLGKLKGNVGGQNYELPAEYDPELHEFVLIWCRRFTTPFAAAPLA